MTYYFSAKVLFSKLQQSGRPSPPAIIIIIGAKFNLKPAKECPPYLQMFHPENILEF